LDDDVRLRLYFNEALINCPSCAFWHCPTNNKQPNGRAKRFIVSRTFSPVFAKVFIKILHL